MLTAVAAVTTIRSSSALVNFAPTSIAILRLGSGTESTTPGTALPVYFDEVLPSTGAVLQSVLYSGTALGAGSPACTLPAPGASGSSWLYDADGIPTNSYNGITWPCYPAAVGSPVDMAAPKTFVYVGNDMSTATAWPVTTHMGVRSGGISGVRQIITLDGANFFVVGNAADYNGLRLWTNGAAATTALSGGVGAGSASGQPGFNYANSISKDVSTNTITYITSDIGAAGVYKVTASTGSDSLYISMNGPLWSLAWTSTANTYWLTFDGGAGHRGSVGRFYRSTGKATTQYNITIDRDNVLYSLVANVARE